MSVWDAALKGNLDGVKAAAENGADIEESGGLWEGTALHHACLNGHTSVAEYLIQRRAEVHSRDKNGYLPIHYDCLNGHVDTVKLIVSKGSDITSTNNNGDTRRHLAIRNGRTLVTEYLTQRGAEAAGN